MLFDKADKFPVGLLLLSRREVSRSIAHEVNTPQKDTIKPIPISQRAGERFLRHSTESR